MKIIKHLLVLHSLFFLYSLLGIPSKLAARESFLSVRFLLLYSIVLLGLLIYALVWQQLLKKMPLITAYSNKAVTIVWGIVWGYLFFEETITVNNIIGAGVIIGGIYLVVSSDYGLESDEND